MRLGRSATLPVVAIIASLFAASVSPAQQPQSGMPVPRLLTVVPCGGKTGSSFEVSFTGQDIEEPEALFFSDPRIKAEPIVPPSPPVDPQKPGAKPPPAPVTKFKVSVPGDVPPSIYDVRLLNKWGISNPRAFVVGDLAEVQEQEPNDDVPQAQRVELNQTINGVIAAPTDIDYFVFAGKAGQRVVFSCLTSSIDSRLLAALELYDGAGRRLACNRHYHHNDALMDCTLPASGDYYVRLYQFAHGQGGPDHFYRLTISTAPWIDYVYPPMVEPGKPAKVTVYGRNLPGGQPDTSAIEDGIALEKVVVEVNAPGDAQSVQRLAYSGLVPPASAALDGFEFRLRNATGISNLFLLTYARAPVILDNDANDSPGMAQPVTPPSEIAGRVERRGDRDWYEFAARKGDVYTIEVFSERLGADTDMYVVLRQADTGRELTALDDNNDSLTPIEFVTRTSDPPAYRFVAPADGKYQVLVASRDADTRAGLRSFYSVRITPERPDFRLIVLPPEPSRPAGCCLRRGGEEQLQVLVWRLDGWSGPVTLTAEGLPSGVTCPPQVVGPNVRQTVLVLSAASSAPLFAGEIRIKGNAVIHGQPVVREARPASITWPVPRPRGIPALSRLDRNLVLAVRSQAPFRLVAAADKPMVLEGSQTKVKIKLTRLWSDFKGPLQLTPEGLPPGITVNNNQPITLNAGHDEVSMRVNIKAGMPPGAYNLVMLGTAQVPFSKDPAAKQKGSIPVIVPSTPVTLTVLPRRAASFIVK